jgi:hypothetical protein
MAPVPPLSPQVQAPIATSGSNAATKPGSGSLVLTPGTSDNPSPSQSALSAPGGGGNSISDCMGFWDSGTHMSKQEWKAACVRVQNRLANIAADQNQGQNRKK